MKLAYVAYDRSGKRSTDTVEAPSVAEAKALLRRRGLRATKVMPQEERIASAPPPGRRFGKSARLKHLAMFSQQLRVLLSSGTPMVQAIEALERQTKQQNWRQILADIRSRVEQGDPLSEAMAAHADVFDTVTRSLLASGESSGNLPAMLERLAAMTKKQIHLRSAVNGAIIYPCLLLAVTLVVLVLLLFFVVPRFSALFKTLRVPLPASTNAMISLSATLKSYWWMVLLVIAAVVLAVRHWLSCDGGRRACDTMVLRLPRVGNIVKNIITARIARLLGVLLDGRVSILTALDLTRQTAGNCHYANLIAQARDNVTRGEPISSAFSDTALIEPAVCEAIRSGERSGQTGPMLLNVANFMDEENEAAVKSLTSIIEPVIMVFMGLLVGLIAVSMLLPIFDLTAMVNRSGR
jgi:type II secretory pathway component PulF